MWAIGDIGPAMVAASLYIEPIALSIFGQIHTKGGHISTVEWIAGCITIVALTMLCAIYYFEERATQREFEKHVEVRKPLIPDIDRSASGDEFIFGE